MLIATTTGDVVLVAFAVVFGLVLLVPETIDLVYSHKARLRWEENEKHARSAESPPKGTVGLARSTMATALLTIIGFAFVYVLATTHAPYPRLVSDVAIALTTTLAAVTAFYFGTKAATRAPTDETAVADTQAHEAMALAKATVDGQRHTAQLFERTAKEIAAAIGNGGAPHE